MTTAEAGGRAAAASYAAAHIVEQLDALKGELAALGRNLPSCKAAAARVKEARDVLAAAAWNIGNDDKPRARAG